MNQSVKPPRILFVRPKSAGSVRSRSQLSSSLAPPSRASQRNPSAPSAPPIAIAASAPPRPVRPLNNAVRRPLSAIGSRRCFAASVLAPPLPEAIREVDNMDVQDPLDQDSAASVDVGNIYRVVVARKDAEDAAQQLVRRIAHFRAQEERVLREMQTMRTHLESSFVKTQEQFLVPTADPVQVDQTPRAQHHQGHSAILHTSLSKDITKPAVASASAKCKRKLKVLRSREQLEFLTKQRRALEVHKLEVARQQKERRKLALTTQKAKEAEQELKRRCRKERIRAEEQHALEQRTEKQRQMQEAATKQHCERLMTEKRRQRVALSQIADMEEEERNLRLRLEALHFHREYMEQELHGSLPRGSD